MARLLGLDLETTGLLTDQDRITEIGAVLWDTDTKTPLITKSKLIYDPSYEEKFTPEVKEMMARVCGLTPEILREFGSPLKQELFLLDDLASRYKVDYVVAQNGENFDIPFLSAEFKRTGVTATYLLDIPRIDTRHDLPFDHEPSSRSLKHLAADIGFINPFAHRAVFDVLTMLKVLSHYDLAKVVEYAKTPWITVRALVSYDDRQLAKDQRFSWEKLGDKSYPKMWVKKIKENQLEKETLKCKFQIARIE